MLVDLLVDVAELIETTLTLDKVSVTLPDPPATDKCSAAYVWGSQLYDAEFRTQSRGEAGCNYQRAYLISYRIDLCYTPAKTEKTTAEQLAESETYYSDADLIYCALMDAASAGTLFQTLGSCEDIAIGPLELHAPQGDRVSALGTLRVTNPCPAGS